MPARHNERGFTLVEVVVTFTLLALLMLMAMPSIGQWLDNTRIRSVAQSLQAGIETARNEAVRRNQNISFWLVGLSDAGVLGDDCTLDDRSPSWVVSVASPAGHCNAAPSIAALPMLVAAHAGGRDAGNTQVRATQADGSTAHALTFNGFGRLATGAASPIRQIDITGPDTGAVYRDLRLTVSPAGQVRMCDPRVSDTGDPRAC